MSHKPLWYLKQIPPALCDAALLDFSTMPKKEANMGQHGEVSNRNHRDTAVRFVDSGHWFSYFMYGLGLEANTVCRWNYEVNGSENIQFGEYGEGQHYDWHVDVFPLAETPVDRKVSVVCLLSDPSEFEGGDLELRLYNDYKPDLQKGSIIVFPSIIEHRVTPVQSGCRRSAVMWMTGPRFK